MKTIKFRAWDVLNSKWFDDIFAVGHSDEGNYVIDLDRWVYFEPTVIIEQFTGLLDKNGKDIYEGDVVMLKEAKRRYEVIFRDYSFKLKHFEDDVTQDLIWGALSRVKDFMWTIEIVGNIHENPELP